MAEDTGEDLGDYQFDVFQTREALSYHDDGNWDQNPVARNGQLKSIGIVMGRRIQ